MQDYRCILFDQDGTLTDSMPGITRCVQHALAHFGLEVSDLRQLTPFIGPPLRDSFREFYHFSPSQVEEAIAIYGERYNSVGLFENQVYDGIPELLSTLKNHGYRLFVATSKPAGLAERILEHYGLRSWFEFVGGGEPEGPRNNKAGVIDYVLRENRIDDRSSVLMIGDRKHDVNGARSAGIDCAGVLWGYGDEPEFAACNATYIVKNITELKNLLLGRDTLLTNE